MTELVRLSQERSAELAQLHAQSFPSGEAWDAAAFKRLLSQASTHAIGIEQGSQLAAFILVQFIRPEAEILTLATAPRFQRLGLAQRIVHATEHELRTDGLEKWLLDVAADNHRAIAFYQKIGFQDDGRRPGYYKRLEGSRVDAILMSKHVSRQETR